MSPVGRASLDLGYSRLGKPKNWINIEIIIEIIKKRGTVNQELELKTWVG